MVNKTNIRKRCTVLILLLFVIFVSSCSSNISSQDSNQSNPSENSLSSEDSESNSIPEESAAESEASESSASGTSHSENVPKPQEKEDEVYIYAGNEWDTSLGDMTGFNPGLAQQIVDEHGEDTLFFVRFYTSWDRSDPTKQLKAEEFYETYYSILKKAGYDVKLFEKTNLYGYLTIEEINYLQSLNEDLPDSMEIFVQYLFGGNWAYLGLNSSYAWRKASEPSYYSTYDSDLPLYYNLSWRIFSDEELRTLAWDAATELFWGKKFHHEGNLWEASFAGENGQIITEQILIEEQMIHYIRSAGKTSVPTADELINAFDPPGVKLCVKDYDHKKHQLNGRFSAEEERVYSAKQFNSNNTPSDDFGIVVIQRDNGETEVICRYGVCASKQNNDDYILFNINNQTAKYEELRATTILGEIKIADENPWRHLTAQYSVLDSADNTTESWLYTGCYEIAAAQPDNTIAWYKIYLQDWSVVKEQYDEDSLYYTFRKRLWGFNS